MTLSTPFLIYTPHVHLLCLGLRTYDVSPFWSRSSILIFQDFILPILNSHLSLHLLSPVFFSLSYKQDKKCSHLQKSPPRTVYLPHINIHSFPLVSALLTLRVVPNQSLFFSSRLILFTMSLQFSPLGTNVLMNNLPLLANPRETFRFL